MRALTVVFEPEGLAEATPAQRERVAQVLEMFASEMREKGEHRDTIRVHIPADPQPVTR